MDLTLSALANQGFDFIKTFDRTAWPPCLVIRRHNA